MKNTEIPKSIKITPIPNQRPKTRSLDSKRDPNIVTPKIFDLSVRFWSGKKVYNFMIPSCFHNA
jgi:hypothetical protein